MTGGPVPQPPIPTGYDRINRYTRIIVDEALGRGIDVEIGDPALGELRLTLGRHTVRLLADAGDLGPVGVDVQADANPPPATDVGRPEEPERLGVHQFLLYPRRRRAPQVRKLVAVMSVPPEHDEGALAPDEPGRGAVARPLGYLGQAQTDGSEPLELVVRFGHRRRGYWRR